MSSLFARRQPTPKKAQAAGTSNQIEVGSVVMYSRNFLRSTGMYTGIAPFAKGVVTALEPFGSDTTLAVIDWGKDKDELPSKVTTFNLVLNSKKHLEAKKATTLVSKQTIEQAIQEAKVIAEQFIDANDSRIDQIEEAISFLESILKKSLAEMQQEGAATLGDYLDDAVMPEMAQKIKQDVDMIAKMKNAGTGQSTAPVMASSTDFISDRDEKGEPKTPELAEVPRLANFKNADLFYGSPKKAEGLKLVPNKPKAPAEEPAQETNPDADIKQLSSDVLAKLVKALSTAEDLMNDKAANRFIGAIAEELASRPVEVEQEEAPKAPAQGAPAAQPAPAPYQLPMAASFGGLNLASAQGGSWFVTDKDSFSIKEDGGRTPEIGQAHSKLEDHTGITRPATELPSKFASFEEWYSSEDDGTFRNGDTLEKLKAAYDAGFDEGYNQSMLSDDNSSDNSVTASKTAAGDMTTTKALKTVERLGDNLKSLYFEAKPVTEVLDSRPVREAVEAIYRAYDMMGEAGKVLNKQRMQEDAEEKAFEVKEKNKGKKSSILAGLNLAAEEYDAPECSKGHELCEICGSCHTCNGGGCDGSTWGHDAEEMKCKCGKPVWGQYGEYSRCKDCLDKQHANAERETKVE